jgi:hypothetical protein
MTDAKSDALVEKPDMKPLTGGCLCGRVQYRIDRAGLGGASPDGKLFGPVANCHCTMCRKAQGGAFGTNASVSTERFALVQGADAITEYESSPGKLRCFCRVCGSPIYSRRRDDPAHVRVRFGTLNEDPGVRAQFHACVDSKAPWFEITDDLPQHGDWVPCFPALG